jgi:hypothetical protein
VGFLGQAQVAAYQHIEILGPAWDAQEHARDPSAYEESRLLFVTGDYTKSIQTCNVDSIKLKGLIML